MTDEPWRPLGFDDDEDAAATYDALHEGVPDWMKESFWVWMRTQFVTPVRKDNYGHVRTPSSFNLNLALATERTCRIAIGVTTDSPTEGMKVLRHVLRREGVELRVADFVLSVGRANHANALDSLLQESGSAWKVGERSGRPGLVRRVAEGVQLAADAVMQSGGAAGAKLAQAWERVYGINPDPTGAYSLAVRAVEDATIPVVVPKQAGATLGHVIGQLVKDDDWSLPLTREDKNAPTSGIVLAHCRALWKGHHDRHGGVPGAGPVTQAEAEVAVSLAVSLVQWFTSGMAERR